MFVLYSFFVEAFMFWRHNAFWASAFCRLLHSKDSVYFYAIDFVFLESFYYVSYSTYFNVLYISHCVFRRFVHFSLCISTFCTFLIVYFNVLYISHCVFQRFVHFSLCISTFWMKTPWTLTFWTIDVCMYCTSTVCTIVVVCCVLRHLEQLTFVNNFVNWRFILFLDWLLLELLQAIHCKE